MLRPCCHLSSSGCSAYRPDATAPALSLFRPDDRSTCALWSRAPPAALRVGISPRQVQRRLRPPCCTALQSQQIQGNEHASHMRNGQHDQQTQQQPRGQHAAGLLGIPGLLHPAGCDSLSLDIQDRVNNVLSAVQAPPGEGMSVAEAVDAAVEACEQEIAQLAPALDIIKEHHPDSSWRDAAMAAHVGLEDVQATVNSLRRRHSQYACSTSTNIDASCLDKQHDGKQSSTSAHDLPYLRSMEQALVSAVTAVMHDERHAPRLPITKEHLTQNPPLAALLHALDSSTGGSSSSGNGSSRFAAVTSNAMAPDCSEGDGSSSLYGSVRPDEPLLFVADGVVLDLADHYQLSETDRQVKSQGVAHTTGINSSNGSSGSHSASPVVCRLALTASTCTSLLSAPALLTAPSCPEEQTLQQLAYTLGVVQRTSVVQHLLDMLRVVRADIAAAMGASSWAAVALAGSAAGHPMAITSFLRQLAGACRAAARQEAAEWLQAVGLANPSDGLSADVLEPWDVESLRQLSAERAAAACGKGSSGVGDSQATWQRVCCDYMGLQQVLEGACELLGGCFGLRMVCSRPAEREAWGDTAWRLDFEDAAVGGHVLAGSFLGSCYVLVDEHHQGLPFTSMVRHGRCEPAGNEPSTAVIILPADFLQQGPAGLDAASNPDDAAPAQPILALDRLVTLVHELGHALHFLLSGAVRTRLRDAACWAHTEVAELPSHLMERLAREPRCLQVLLRHRTTGHSPPPLLCKQVAAYMRSSLKGPYMYQEHLCAALTDQLLCALPGDPTAEGYFGTAEVMAEVTREYSALAQVPVSVRMLQWLPGMAQLAGCMHAYPVAELVAAALWEKYFQDPLDTHTPVRRLLLEQGASKPLDEIVQGLLGHGSMEPVWAQQGAAASGSDGAAGTEEDLLGCVPCLEHPAYQDTDLWG